jgi:hypothetical protein
MTVDFIYQLAQFISNKNQNGYIAPAQFNLIIQQAQISFLDYLLGEFQQYTIGRPQARVSYGMNEVVRQRLTPLIDPPTFLTIDNTGFSPYPEDFQQVDAMYTSVFQKRVKYVQQDSLYSYMNSQIDSLVENPIFLIQSNGFQFYNVLLGEAQLSYVKTPPPIIWGFAINPQGRPVYSPAASTDPVWYDVDCLEILSRALTMIGINLQMPEITQYSQMITKQGQ